MRLIWNDNNFQAEISLQADTWKDDVELLKLAGFRTDGPPQWIWKTDKIAPLDYLKKNQPKSGLSITELALEKYTVLKQQHDKKVELKKQFKKAAEELAQPKWETYQDQETGLTCFVVKPIEETFKWKYIPPPKPEVYCFVCGDPLYFPDAPDVCVWCEKVQEKA